MKNIKLVLLLLCAMTPLWGMAQTPQVSKRFVVYATMPGANTKTDGYFIAGQWQDASGKVVKKVVEVSDGKFTFEGDLSGFTMLRIERFSLINKNDTKDFSNFNENTIFVEAGDTKVTCTSNPMSCEVTQGSAANKEYKELMNRARPLYAQLGAINKSLSDTTSNAKSASELHKSEDKIRQQLSEDVFAPFIKSHPKSPVSIFAIGFGYVALNPSLSQLPKVKALYSTLSDQVKNTGPGVDFASQLEGASKSQKGANAN